MSPRLLARVTDASGRSSESSVEVAVAPASDTHEPAGMTPIFHADGTSKDWGPMWHPWDGWDTNAEVVEDPQSPSGYAIQRWKRAGDGEGFCSLTVGTIPRCREVYIRLTRMFSPSWQPHPSGTTKMFFYGQHPQPTQFYPQFYGGPKPGVIRWRDQMRDAHALGVFAPMKDDPDPERFAIYGGRYLTLEIHHAMESASGRRDGFVRNWLNGVPLDPWAWLAPGHSGEETYLGRPEFGFFSAAREPYIDGLQFDIYWGGDGGEVLRDMWFRDADLYISGKPLAA